MMLPDMVSLDRCFIFQQVHELNVNIMIKKPCKNNYIEEVSRGHRSAFGDT